MRDRVMTFAFRADHFKHGILYMCNNSGLWLGASVVNAETGEEYEVSGFLGFDCYSIVAVT